MRKTCHIHKLLAWIAVLLVVAQLLLILLSWLITAALPEVFTHSLLSAEGIRWFFGKFTENLASPFLVWLLLGSIAWGALKGSGLLRYDRSEYRKRVALRLVLIEFGVFIAVLALLSIVPHAILLNVMGGFLASSFSKSIIPYCCFALLVISVSYGLMSDKLKGLEDVFDVTCLGVKDAAPLFLLYVLAVQFYSSFIYTFG